MKIAKYTNGPKKNQNYPYSVGFIDTFHLAAQMSWYLQTPNCAYLSNTRANCGFSCWAPLLSFLEFWSIEKAGQQLGRASQALPWSRRKKCEIYKFQGENHRSSGATFTDMKTTKFWKHYVSRVSEMWKDTPIGPTASREPSKKRSNVGPPLFTNFAYVYRF